jgi:hypothetical protein
VNVIAGENVLKRGFGDAIKSVGKNWAMWGTRLLGKQSFVLTRKNLVIQDVVVCRH